ncbi:MAG: hypothetical protein PHC44_03460 [Lutispora sp.]|nr:hypothetical protein [Lutispora sp.]MDD4833773.1 hypothetical protein [Lutispora sp.]
MRIIQMKLALYTALSCIVLLLCLFFFIEGYTIFNIDIRIVFVLLFTVLAALLAAEYYRYNTAKLIMDNKIIYIQVTKIEENCEKKIYNTLSTIVIEYIISCFGVLLGSKVIKFNVDGIKLIEVKIDHDFIFIVYGKDNWNKTIRLLHGSLSTQELRDFVERFRYETGITPNVID